MRSRLCFTAASLLVFNTPIAARAQANSSAEWGLFNVRYDTHTSDFIYAAYGYRRVFGMAAVLENPRTGYAERLGAVGAAFTAQRGRPQLIAVGVAHASDAWYAQIYYMPTLHVGPTNVRAASKIDVPFERTGKRQLSVSPLSFTVPEWGRTEIGVAADVAAAERTRASFAAGPELRIALPRATLGTDVQRIFDDHSMRLRLSFAAAF